MSIYFLRHGDLMKIGYSSDLGHRVRAIMNAVPGNVEFIGHMPGDREVEAHLHQQFAASRFSGEWFVVSDQLLLIADAILSPELPEAVSTPTFAITRGRDVKWKETSVRLRTAAALLWPACNHAQRKANIAESLGWGSRRVRSLYEAQAKCSLRQSEFEQIDAKIFSKVVWPEPDQRTPIHDDNTADDGNNCG